MKDKDILAVCETGFQKAVNLINVMRTILANLKERINSQLKSKKTLQRKIATPRASLIARDYQLALQEKL
ncbi:MAG: hypothetical protein U9O41_09265 [Candidatus Aerophobetes bacterium]|nr:hypothetical protein [Candidatus Aerophobetes bacterium]